MKRLIKSLLAGAGALALVAILAPTDASAQSCRSSHGYGHSRGHQAYDRGHDRGSQRRYVAPRRARTYSSRVVTHPHYGGPIYYRNSSHYVRPTVSYRSTYVVPSYGYSYGYATQSRRRCR